MGAMMKKSTEVASDARASGRSWQLAARLALGLSIACALGELAAGPGFRAGLWGLGAGLLTIRWGATAAAVLFFLGLVGTVLSQRRQARGNLRLFIAASLISLVAAAPPSFFWFRASKLPHIHDVSTDTDNPPQYVAILPLRAGARNATRYDIAVAPQQRLGYPDIAPVKLDLPVGDSFRLAERVARSMGWEIVAVAPDQLRLEATATTLLFGFKDDIVIRVKANGDGSQIDVRSLSRVGGSDFGTNAARIRAFIKKLKADRAQ
jgi:uncharacterized protein (DUF1499 family)